MWLPVICPLSTLKERPAHGGSLHSGHVKYREFLLRALGHHMILSPEAYHIHRFEYFQDLPFSALALTWGNRSISLHLYIFHPCVCVHAHTHTESSQTVAIRIICIWTAHGPSKSQLPGLGSHTEGKTLQNGIRGLSNLPKSLDILLIWNWGIPETHPGKQGILGWSWVQSLSSIFWNLVLCKVKPRCYFKEDLPNSNILN